MKLKAACQGLVPKETPWAVALVIAETLLHWGLKVRYRAVKPRPGEDTLHPQDWHPQSPRGSELAVQAKN